MKSFSSFAFALIIVGLINVFLPVTSQAATIAYWDFEDGTDGTLLSDLPSGGSADIENSYIMYGYGAWFSSETPTGIGLSAYCNGDDGYTTDSTLNAWSPIAWRIEVSVRLDDISGWETIIGRDGSTNGDQESDFYLQKSNGGPFRINYETVTGQRWILDSDFSPNAGQWYHLAVASDGATLTMYCDKLDGNGSQVVGTLDISSQTPAQNAFATSGLNWIFGRGWWNGGNVDHIDGYFDNVRFIEYELAAIITETNKKTVLFTSDTTDTDDYSVVLLQQPSGDVTVTVTPPAGLTVGNGDGQPVNLTFTSQNWDTPQTVTVAIAGAGIEPNVMNIQQTAQINDPDMDVYVRDVEVYIEENTCSIWGYLDSDYNLDCVVDLKDFAILGGLWLQTELLTDLQEFSLDWLGTHGNTKYLYSSFRNNGEDGLHLAYSDDGLTFTALKGDASFLAPAVGSNLMRDPSISQGPDGMFHLVWTTGWWDNGIGIAHSPDLINWYDTPDLAGGSNQTYLPVMAGEPDAKNCWAPEIFYDDATGKFLIFWSTTIDPSSSDDHRIYYISTEDFVTYTDTALFYDPGFNCIDGFIAKDGDRYAMVFKDERSSGKNIRITFSENAAGPYDVPPSASISPGGVEGPSMIKVSTEWILYYDFYASGAGIGGQSSTDLTNWTDRTNDISFPGGTRHGTVFKVTQDVLDALLAL